MASYTVRLTVEAYQLDPATFNAEQMAVWCGGVAEAIPGTTDQQVRLLTGGAVVQKGDWVVRLGRMHLMVSDGEFQRLFNPEPPAVDDSRPAADPPAPPPAEQPSGYVPITPVG